jgi:capsule polysaccharide export protein KpsE/RkpR
MLAALGKSSELAALGSELFGVKTSGDLFVGLAKSDTVENAIVRKFDLFKVYGVKRLVDARKRLESQTEVSADRKSGIIVIKVDDSDPKRAAALGQEYVNQLNSVVITLDTSSAHRERVFLENRLKEVQVDLEKAEKDFSEFASKNVALDVKEQGRAMIGATAELEGQLIAAQTELEGLRQIYTNENVRVRSVQARIDEYRRQLQKLGGKNSTTSTAPADGATEQNADLYPSIRQLPLLGVTWADLYRRTKVEEAVFETLIKQYELAKVNEAREIPSVKVLDPAEVPEKKSFPPRTLIVLIVMCLAFVFGCIRILADARWQELSPDDPGKKLAEEIAGTVRGKFSFLRRGRFEAKTSEFGRKSQESDHDERRG